MFPVRSGLLAVIAVLLTSPVATSSPASAAGTGVQSSQVSLDSPRLRARDGGSISLMGRVSTAASDDTGHRVILESRSAGQNAWRQIGSQTSSGDPRKHTDGSASWSIRGLHYDISFRISHPAQTVRGVRFAASASNAVTVAVGAPRTFSLRDTGRSRSQRIDLIPGDVVAFTADECPGCGYRWNVARATDSRFVTKTQDAYTEPRTSATPTVGGSGTHSYAWTAKAAVSRSTPGRTSTTLRYDPPGRGSPADHSVTFTFNVFA